MSVGSVPLAYFDSGTGAQGDHTSLIHQNIYIYIIIYILCNNKQISK